MFTLKSLSPSRASLSIPSPGGRINSSSPNRSNPTSPSTSPGGRSPSSESGYFPIVTTPTARITKSRPIGKEEAFKTVKNLEDVLNAWNEYRLAIANVGKAGRKLAGALKDLASGGGEKTDVASQTIGPTANMLDNLSDLTLKLSRKIDKEYDEVNSDALKYFNLLAKESRTHDAYLGAIGKKHDKAEKAFRKASKTLSETSSAHAGLVALKVTLNEDINRANEDHHTLIGTKQSIILLKIASSSGCLAEYILAYFSDGLRKSGQSFPDIEYFRTLADIKWRSSLPPSLEEEQAEERFRERIRGVKAKVALGELDMIGKGLWEGTGGKGSGGHSIQNTSNEAIVTAAVGTTTENDLNRDIVEVKTGGLSPSPSAKESLKDDTRYVSDKSEVKPQSIITQKEGTVNSSTGNKTSSAERPQSPATPQHTSPPIPHDTRPSVASRSSTAPSHSSKPSMSTGTTSSTSTRSDAPDGRRPIPSGLVVTPKEPDSPKGPRYRDRTMEADRPISRYEDARPVAIARSPEGARPAPIPIQGHNPRRSVSNIVNDLQNRQHDEGYYKSPLPLPHLPQPLRHVSNQSFPSSSYYADPRERSFQHHQNHHTFMRGCELCEMDYERM
ncbi:hypothetical protein L486_06695 [Kwoniella mangroviensis CBS 10435]|uniref:IMD domain-containing protein n=1 Tax=Kwoniella mangroviensis CBS 10435 TaxID=1331196 RepID=A0A1B9IJT5_9TREE|nr:hypothetical protein L486_06695 [Kwoniella mangroviensis CBS 10435]